MARGKDRGLGSDQVSPTSYPETTPTVLPSGDYSYTLEVVMNMQLSLGKLTEAVDSLKAVQKSQNEKLERVSRQIYAAVLILILVGGVFTFFAKSINDLITHAILNSTPQQQQAAPSVQQQQPKH